LFDLFHYAAADGLDTDPIGSAAGARDISPGTPGVYTYFSYNGSTVTLPFEAPGEGDLEDWADTDGGKAGVPYVARDSFGAQQAGVASPMSATDLQVLQVVGYDIACYVTGTRIATDNGEVPVEHLRIDDTVLTASGETRPMRWIGHRRVDCRRHPKPQDLWPVRVQAGAFGTAMPHRDLWLSPDHAAFIDGVLIPIRYLINDATIAQEPVESVTYWHVELDQHDVILAEGLSCESYLDTGNRGAFANGGAEMQMHPDFARKVWEASSCARLVVEGAELEAARSHLLQRAGTLGYAATNDAALCLVVDGCELKPRITGRVHRFRLPAAARHVRLASRSAVPAHVRDDSDDYRCLGVAVSRIALDGEPIALSDPRLGSGWHDAEAGDGADAAPDWRWTSGDAGLKLAGARELEIEVAITARYWLPCAWGAAQPHAAPTILQSRTR
jgi:hypothetical protein